jgi:hypothetical protein
MRDLIRTRWAAVGAAVAVTLGAGGVSLTQAALTTGEKPVYVSLDAPCRVVDTRTGSPIGAGDAAALPVQITGENGACTGPLAIPADAVGVSTNVTVIQPNGAASGRSYFTVYPTGATRPVTSNLNFVNGQAPTPNKVDVGIGAGGQITIYNNEGTAHAAVDIFGYYIDHNHDDRYYTKAELDAAVAAIQSVAAYAGGDQQVALTTADQVVRSVSITAPAAGTVIVNSSGYVWLASGTSVIARCSLTTGTTVDGTAMQYVEIQGNPNASDVVSGTRGYDVAAGDNLTVNLVCDEFSGQANVSDTWISAIFVPSA